MSLMDGKDNASLERGADNDIVRLRWRLQIRENIIGRLVAENERLRNGTATSCETVALTAEERAAVETAMNGYIAWKDDNCALETPFAQAKLATLRNLLARLS
jgi:hypothetical protein